MVAGCGKSGSRFANVAPTIKITSFEGWDDSYIAAGYDTTATYSFQQRIYWHASDPDGIIAGYAFRILDDNGNPIATPGYQYIDTPQSLLPPVCLPWEWLGDSLSAWGGSIYTLERYCSQKYHLDIPKSMP
jgi:hypothetical protein